MARAALSWPTSGAHKPERGWNVDGLWMGVDGLRMGVEEEMRMDSGWTEDECGKNVGDETNAEDEVMVKCG